MLWLVLLALVACFIYVAVIKPMGYWKERNIPYKQPWPILGNFEDFFLRKLSFVDVFKKIYNYFPDRRYFGIYGIGMPQILIRDPELIKQVTIKDFDYFMDRQNPIGVPNHYYITNDAIATSAFGVTVDSLNDKQNDFFVMGKDATNFKGLRSLKFFAFSLCPTLLKLLKVTIFPKSFTEFFTRIIQETIEIRQTKGIIRPDMIHILLEARKGKLSHEDSTVFDAGFAVVDESSENIITHQEKALLTDNDITAQAMIFFFAGFETASTLMSFMSHELAINTDIQEKLQMEIDETLERCNGKITYEGLLRMKYLDMVISESLRKWSPALMLERLCVKDYMLKPERPNEAPFVIEKGTSLIIPVVAIHHDPKYFPNPGKFDPERFSDENKSSIIPFTYLPFGVGPRSCIASRFALMETKVLFFYLLSKFDIVPTEKTSIPLVLSKKQLIPAPDEGFWLGLRQRKSSN